MMARKLDSFMAPEDLTLEETRELLALAKDLKKSPHSTALKNKFLGMLFFNPSLRTRISFDVAMQELGGSTTVLDIGSNSWNLEFRDNVIMDGDTSEHIREAAKVLSRYVDALSIRAFPKYTQSWEENRTDPVHRGFQREADVPIINMESSLYHPCQSLADIMTLEEKLGGVKKEPILISWGWHVNPLPMAVSNSILVEACKHGMEVRLAHPEGWELDPAVMSKAEELSGKAGGSLKLYDDFEDALPGARAVYMKSWGSIRNYGNPDKERAEALKFMDKWRLTMEHMDITDRGNFLHCLPVRRGVEVTADVLDSDYSATIDEAENRLHVQKALLMNMLAN